MRGVRGVARAAVAAPAGNVLSIGDPDALGQIDLYVDPLCPFSGRMVQTKGAEIARRLAAGTLRVNLRFVDFLDKRSASGTYDDRAIYAAYVVADQSRSSDTTWQFVERIYPRTCSPRRRGHRPRQRPTRPGGRHRGRAAAGRESDQGRPADRL